MAAKKTHRAGPKVTTGRTKVRGDYYTDPEILNRQKAVAEALGWPSWNAWVDMHLRAQLEKDEARVQAKQERKAGR